MQDKDQILSTLKKLKSSYASEGIIFLGLFGSYSRDMQNKFSDIDIVYEIDREKFTKNYHGGFAKLLRLNDIRRELEGIFHKPVDLVSNSNKAILKDVLYV